tara:strand:+ start:379 stop:1251 length:873 start_codon:yes stop_codon:yes gene_type:complete
MSELFFSADGEDYSVAHTAKHITDKCLFEIMRTCVSGNEIRPYVDLAIIGYGTSIRSATPKIPMEQLPFSVTELQKSYIAKNEIDDSNIGDFSKPRYEWVEEMSSGTTSMLAALQKAKEITEKWISNHRNSFPPMILNITDGMATDDLVLLDRFQHGTLGDMSTLDLVTTVKEIQKLATTDGNVLLCNAHVSPDEMSQITYPTNTQNIENPLAELMFEMSSVIPSTLLETGKEMGLPIQSGSRLFLYNAEVTSLLNFLRFGTSAAMISGKKSEDKHGTGGELEDKTNSGN